jgi:hypothetical protein
MDPVSAIANAVGGIFGSLSTLGIGSKSRQAEADNAAQNAAEIEASKSKSLIKILAISGVLTIVIVVIFLTLRKK